MIKIYRFISYLLAPFIRLYFYARCCYGKDEWKSVSNHFGKATLPRPNGRIIWVHAASIGESTAAMTYISSLLEHHPDIHILLTTITVTSANILQKKLQNMPNCIHQFVVADNPFWIDRFLNYWNIEKAIFLESEIWPNILFALSDRKIPTFLINARLSPRSFSRWNNFAPSFFSQILSKFDCILAQSEGDLQRFSHFSPKNIEQMDNLKYANAELPADDNLLKILQNRWQGKKIFVAASTHEGEEEVIIQAHLKLKEKFDLITVIIPRHINRVSNICDLLKQSELKYELRSKLISPIQSLPNESPLSEILCVDTFGDVGTFYRLADVTFVGGSLTLVGGHNIYEPVALGKSVLHGPNMNNALEMRDFLHNKGVAFEVNSANDICKFCEEFFTDDSKRAKISEIANSIRRNNALEQIHKHILID